MIPFQLVMDTLPILIFVKDEESRMLYLNRACLDLYPPERRAILIGTTTVEEFAPEQAALFLAEDQRAFAQGQTEIVEEITDYAGRRRVFRSRKIAFTTEAGERRLLGVSDDITELADREKHQAELNTHLQNFAALAAHDLRSPLGSCIGVAEMVLLDKHSTLSTRSRTYLDMMISTFTTLGEGIETLLLATKAGHRGGAIASAQCDLNVILEEVKFALSRSIESSGAQVYAMRLPTLAVEPRLFRQLLQNLIENSIKYGRVGTAPLIVIRYEERDSLHVFSVEDSGQGMSPRVAARAFELYEQDASSGVTGVGLGLSLCKRIVELHKGLIWVDQSWTKGCKIMWSISSAGLEAAASVRSAA